MVMEKISLKNFSSFGLSPLSTVALKEITGKFSSVVGGCKNSLGGCDVGDNCQRGGGGFGKCDVRSSICGCF